MFLFEFYGATPSCETQMNQTHLPVHLIIKAVFIGRVSPDARHVSE